MILSFLITAVLLALIPHNAWAWGPATHLEYASNALLEIAAFAPAVKTLLTRFSDHFLYGSIAADITIGKGLRGYLYNCHNWQVAFKIFDERAKKDQQKAFMLGYLGHLAADTVSHNLFVPYKMVRSWDTKLLKHVYWEMRMDLSVPEKYWELMEKFTTSSFGDDDALLEGSLKKMFFSFKTSKKIFNSLLVIQRMRHYKKVATTVADKSVYTLSPHDIADYKKLALSAVVDFLKNPEKAFSLKTDPTGRARMVDARLLVGQLRQAKLNGELNHESEAKVLSQTKQRFREMLTTH